MNSLNGENRALKNQTLKKKVRVEGVEPPRREALDPKSSMSTNSIIPAFQKLCKDIFFSIYR